MGIKVVLALGSNIGNRVLYLKLALKLLPVHIINKSAVYETEALLPSGAPKRWNKKYLNMVVSCYTPLSPVSLLKNIKAIEVLLGRHDYRKWSPRTIDIDILLWGSAIINQKNLRIPHVELHTRDFVLQPLQDIMPRYIHQQKSIKVLLRDLDG